MLTQFPYTNYQNLNLDWILGEIKKLPDYIQTQIDLAINNNFATATYDPATETIILKVEEGNDG